MNRILKHLNGRKGITLVLMALMLAILLMFAGLAIDIAYMYYVKNELQVAADAAALAGAAKLDGCLLGGCLADTSLHYSQTYARQDAWKFACKNRAAGQSVFLVTNCSNSNPDCKPDYKPDDCNDLLASDLNGTSNTSTEDIVVGHWRPTDPGGVSCPSDGWEAAGSGYFCRANGSTGLPINALKTRPRRTNETPGMPQVEVFIGRIFRFIGGDWSYMSARASAIALLDRDSGTVRLVK